MSSSATPARPTTPRQVADAYVEAVSDLDPIVATSLGNRPGDDRLPDPSPEGLAADAERARGPLAELDRVLAADPALEDDPIERRCARLLRERLTAQLAVYDAGEEFRALSNLFSPVHSIRQVFSLMPAATDDDWGVIARRMARVPGAYRGYRASLEEGARRGLFAGPRQVSTVVGQLGEWLAGPYFAGFVANGPDALRGELDAAAAAAGGGVAGVRGFLRGTYAPQGGGAAGGGGGGG